MRPGRDADPSFPSSSEVKYTSTLPKGLRGLRKGETYQYKTQNKMHINYIYIYIYAFYLELNVVC